MSGSPLFSSYVKVDDSQSYCLKYPFFSLRLPELHRSTQGVRVTFSRYGDDEFESKLSERRFQERGRTEQDPGT